MTRAAPILDPVHVMNELSRADRHLARVIRRVGSFSRKLPRSSQPFESLFETIVYQQITGKAAVTILGRVRAVFGKGAFPTPQAVLRVSRGQLRHAGLSRQKIAAIRDLATKTLDGTVPSLRQIRRMDDEEILERLTAVRGIGEWSVQMYLISRLGRPDILPIKDYGVRKGFQRVYGHKEIPEPQTILEHGERWRPYRSIASWYLWRATEEKIEKEKPRKPLRRPLPRRQKERDKAGK